MDHNSVEHSTSDETLSGKNEKAGLSLPLRMVTLLMFIGCGLYAALFGWHGIQLILYPFDVDNSEAFVVYQGQRIAQGAFLYPPLEQPPYLVDPYPPLFPLLEAAGFYFTGPNFQFPRLLSFSAAVITAIMLGHWTLLQTRRKNAALLSTLVFLSFYHVYDWCALARVDSVGLCFSIAGLVLFELTQVWRLPLILFILSLLTKQTLFAAPLAVFCCLIFSNKRKEAYRFLGLLLGSGLLLFLILVTATAGGAWKHLVLYNVNTYRLTDLWYYIRHWLIFYTVWGCAPLVLLIQQLPKMRRFAMAADMNSSRQSVLFWYTLFACGEAVLCGKIGAAPNYLLSLVCATAVGVGIIFSEIYILKEKTEHPSVNTIILCFAVAGLFQLGATIHWPLPGQIPYPHRFDWSYTPSREDRQAGWLVMQELKNVAGPVLSDRAGVALQAGHPPIFEPFICTQLSKEKRWDQQPLLSALKKHTISRLVLNFDLSDSRWDRERFTPEMIEVMNHFYVLDRRIGRYWIYIPKNNT